VLAAGVSAEPRRITQLTCSSALVTSRTSWWSETARTGAAV
jgi:hypothetical protein